MSADACYCYPCRLFGNACFGQSRPETCFTVKGFRDWKHATGKNGILACHDNCFAHKQATIAWNEYKINCQMGTSLPERMSSIKATIVKNNRHYLKTVIEILLLSHQEISFRGHDESKISSNQGNFLEVLNIIANHDEIIKEKLINGPKNALYTSAEIQNELLDIMATMIRSKICSSVRKAGVYSILADETKDCSKKEQLAIVLRYVDIETATVCEQFLTYVEATKLDADSLSTYIITTLNQHGLDPKCIVSQGYDGASVMSGRCSGVQKRIREIAPQAIYVHCYAHCLNLALVDTYY